MKLSKIILFVCVSLVVSKNVIAQEQTTKQKMLEGIKKEKLRTPIKIADLAEEELQSFSIKKNRGIETKLSATTLGNEEGEAQICIDPNNANRLVVSYMNNTSSGLVFPIYFSNDGGSSWTKSTFSPASLLNTDFPGMFVGGGGDPVFAYDKNGTLYFSWIYLVVNQALDTATGAMYWAKSVDNGATFTVEQGDNHFIGKSNLDLNTFEALPGSDGFYDRQWFAIDVSNGANANTLYTSFIYFNTPAESPSLTGATIKKLAPSGTAFGNKLQAMSGQIQFNNVRVDNVGTLHISGADIDNNVILYCKSTDGGATFSSPITVYSGTNMFGNSFIHDRENAAVNMEVDGAKNVHLVWSDYPSSGSIDVTSFYARLDNATGMFNTPLDLNTLFFANKKVLMPVISTAGNRVTIGTYIVDANFNCDYYLIHSDNNGASWTLPEKISTVQTKLNSASNAGTFFGDYFNAVRTDTKAYNVWSDGRTTGGPKMYVNVSSLAALGLSDVTPINSNMQLKNFYPNPIQDQLHLQFETQMNDVIEIEINSIDGKVLQTQKYKLHQGNQVIVMPLQALAVGNYILKIINQDGFLIKRNIQKK